jgi:hypothetical protein
MVPDGLTLACPLYRHFILVLRQESWSPLDEQQTCFQHGQNHSVVQSSADNPVCRSGENGKLQLSVLFNN